MLNRHLLKFSSSSLRTTNPFVFLPLTTTTISSSLFHSTQLLLGTRPGTVLKWDDERLFGFIKDDETGDQYFCHKKDLKVDGSRAIIFLKPEEKVTFDIADNPIRGPGAKKCVNVTQGDGTPFGRATGTPVVMNRRRVSGFVSYMKIGSSFGFLTADDEKESRIFFHARDVKSGHGPLYHRDRVIFDILADEEREGKAKAVLIEKKK